MFTIKHIHPTGAENLYQSPIADYSPGSDRGAYVEPATVWIEPTPSQRYPLTGGTIFVTNDNGKTVARYDLAAPDYRDPEQASFAAFSAEKDGGLAAEAVETLRRNGSATQRVADDEQMAYSGHQR